MRFASTRNLGQVVGLKDTIFNGLAPDGGLYIPLDEPDLHELFIQTNKTSSFQEISSRIFSALFPQEFSAADARRICDEAFTFSPALVSLGPGIKMLELFHGPSCAFKDFGASFLATLMQEYLKTENNKAIILTATSGDTGSAVAQAFHGKSNIDVVILYPSGRVSPSQEMQLTTVGGNVHALEVQGSFDDCQRMVKEAFIDAELRTHFPLSSANSINLGRLIPQAFYYAYAFAQLKDQEDGGITFCVPSGNFGNLTAGVLAWRWGLPITRFVAATNVNDVVPEYLTRGMYQARPSIQTHANAMDVGNPSNFERLQYIFHSDISAMRAMIHGEVVNDKDTLSTMKRYYEKQGSLLCPHTAVGALAAERYRDAETNGEGCIVTLSTAHPGKFSEVVYQACGIEPEIPERLAEYMRRTKHADLVGPRLEDLKVWMLRNLSY